MRHKWNCNQCGTPEGCTIIGDEASFSLIPSPVCPFSMGVPLWQDAGEDQPPGNMYSNFHKTEKDVH